MEHYGKRAGLAWIAKDARGRQLGKGTTVANYVGSPLIAESMAIFEAVLHAKQLHLPKLEIHSDVMNAIKLSTQGSIPRKPTKSSITLSHYHPRLPPSLLLLYREKR